MKAAVFDQELFDRVQRVAQPGRVISTLGIARPNRITSVSPRGVEVETERSTANGTGAQLVPAWMVVAAWDHLRLHGSLTNQELLHRLGVKRSAFVSALLAQFDEVEVQSLRPIRLCLIRHPRLPRS